MYTISVDGITLAYFVKMQQRIAYRSSKCRCSHYFTPLRAVGVDALPCLIGASARFPSRHTVGVSSSRFGATVFFFKKNWPYHSIHQYYIVVHALELRANLNCVYRELVRRAITVAVTRPAHCSRDKSFWRPYSRADESVFDGKCQFFSVTCRDGGSFPSVSTCSEPTLSFVAVVRVAFTASGLAEVVITWETASEHGNNFFDGCRVSEYSKRASQVDW